MDTKTTLNASCQTNKTTADNPHTRNGTNQRHRTNMAANLGRSKDTTHE